MNLILCSREQYASRLIVLEEERAEHVRCVHRAKVGDQLRVGVRDGAMGYAKVLKIERRRVELAIEEDFEDAPPAAHPLCLAVAMCRPPSLHKVLTHATSLGVKHFMVFHARRSEKSFWDSHAMEPQAIEHTFQLGLEQAKDTKMPSIEWHRRFRPFAEDHLGQRIKQAPVWLADPLVQAHPFAGQSEACGEGTLVVGPEGGFVPFERELLLGLGARGVNLGPRILRVEVATIALLSCYTTLGSGAEPA